MINDNHNDNHNHNDGKSIKLSYFLNLPEMLLYIIYNIYAYYIEGQLNIL